MKSFLFVVRNTSLGEEQIYPPSQSFLSWTQLILNTLKCDNLVNRVKLIDKPKTAFKKNKSSATKHEGRSVRAWWWSAVTEPDQLTVTEDGQLYVSRLGFLKGLKEENDSKYTTH